MKNKFYKVDLYQVLGPCCSMISKSTCDADSLGKIIVSISKNSNVSSNNKMFECREVMNDFNVLAVDCSKGSRFDAWYAEDVPELHLPYQYDYWKKYRNFIVRANDLNESNLATEDDIKKYNPEKEVWYKIIKEINEKGINYDYEKEIVLSKGKENE